GKAVSAGLRVKNVCLKDVTERRRRIGVPEFVPAVLVRPVEVPVFAYSLQIGPYVVVISAVVELPCPPDGLPHRYRLPPVLAQIPEKDFRIGTQCRFSDAHCDKPLPRSRRAVVAIHYHPSEQAVSI